MLSAVITSQRSQPAVPLAEQLAHQRLVRPGPLVLRTALLKIPTRAVDRDRTVSRRSKPSSRAALMGEQPNPWDRPQPQDARADIEVPNHAVAVSARARSACYPRGTFYPLSDGASTCHRQITSPDFRPCSRCPSHSQAPLCTYTRNLIANQAEGTFGRLRYLLGGDRPSQTTHQALSLNRITVLG